MGTGLSGSGLSWSRACRGAAAGPPARRSRLDRAASKTTPGAGRAKPAELPWRGNHNGLHVHPDGNRHRKGNVACCMRACAARLVARREPNGRGHDNVGRRQHLTHGVRACILRNDARQRNPKQKRTRHGQARRSFALAHTHAHARAHTHTDTRTQTHTHTQRACTRMPSHTHARTRLATSAPGLGCSLPATSSASCSRWPCRSAAGSRPNQTATQQRPGGIQHDCKHADYASITRLPVRAAKRNLISICPRVRTARHGFRPGAHPRALRGLRSAN